MQSSKRPVNPAPAVSWRLVVPVKRLSLAKTRLGVTDEHLRARLALAFALDTVGAALRCDAVDAVVVVTDDPVANERLRDTGADVVGDEPDSGLNPAIAHGARHALAGTGGYGIGALSADLPALRPDDLLEALDVAARLAHAYVPDAHDEGTTLLTAGPGEQLGPEFGHGSSARHRLAGARDLAAVAGTALSSLRRDVDTRDDLRRALELGVGLHTSGVVDELVARGALPEMPRES